MKSSLACTFYPTHSSDTTFRYKPMNEPKKTRVANLKPFIFTQEIVFSNVEQRAVSLVTPGAISLEKLTFQKFKEQKQMLENARLPSFHIKRLMNRSSSRQKETRMGEGGKEIVAGWSKRQMVTQEQVKHYWQSYLRHEIMKQDGSRLLLSPLGKCKKVREQLPKELSQRHRSQKQAFFMNNFIKTTYRRRKDNNTTFGYQLSLNHRRDALKSRREDSINQMAPWDKENQEEDGFNFHQSAFNVQ